MIFFSYYSKFKELGWKKKHFSEWKKREYCKMEAIVWLDLENQPSAEGIISNSDFQFFSLRYSRFVTSHMYLNLNSGEFSMNFMNISCARVEGISVLHGLLGIRQAFRRFMRFVYEVHKKFTEYHKTNVPGRK